MKARRKEEPLVIEVSARSQRERRREAIKLAIIPGKTPIKVEQVSRRTFHIYTA